MAKRLVVCSDGTWNRPDRGCPTNVIKMARALATRDADGNAQVVFYDPGVGTGDGLDRLTGGVFGEGLSGNVLDGYRFLIHNYEPDDAIYLFGFSRGAFTSRSLGGLIRNCGLLKKRHSAKIPEAYDLYRDRAFHPRSEAAATFRADFSFSPRIRFIGVWDTVGALGVPLTILRRWTMRKYQFHDTELSSTVDAAFHALAIDEKRGAFAPTLWTNPKADGQRVEQVWFAGVHSNVGGGYEDAGLADLAFEWMKDRAEECGLSFDPDYLSDTIRPSEKGTLYDSRKGFYKLMRKHVRTIGALTNGTESVDPSVHKRRDADLSPPYRPENLPPA